MLMAMDGLFKADLIEWMTSMTYQAASGGGAKHMRELIAQMGRSYDSVADLLADPTSSILDVDRDVIAAQRSSDFPVTEFKQALAGSLLPWIDADLGNGQSREEWKAAAEGNKILGRHAGGSPGAYVPIDGICVRVGAMRCHSQALTVKLRRDVPLDEVEQLIAGGNDWVTVVSNDKEATLRAAHADGGHRHAGCAGRPAEEAVDGPGVPRRRSPWAISCSGARPSRCAGCCGSSWRRRPPRHAKPSAARSPDSQTESGPPSGGPSLLLLPRSALLLPRSAAQLPRASPR